MDQPTEAGEPLKNMKLFGDIPCKMLHSGVPKGKTYEFSSQPEKSVKIPEPQLEEPKQILQDLTEINGRKS